MSQSNQDALIRKAVELADGWLWATYSDSDLCELELANGAYWYDDADSPITPDQMPRTLLDALAAQLVRQVDALSYEIISSEGHCGVYDQDGQDILIEVMEYYDRTMNTIKAIVDSGVLANKQETGTRPQEKKGRKWV